MALTTAQKVALYQILEMPMFATARILTDPDNLVIENHTVEASVHQAIQELEAHLTDLADNYSEHETVLAALLDKWVALSTDVTTIEQGGVGNMQGLSDNPEMERVEIRRQVLVIAPFYRRHQELSRLDEMSASLAVMRN